MEPFIIDFYNEMPYGVNVIENMNKELIKIQDENSILNDKVLDLKRLIENNNRLHELEIMVKELQILKLKRKKKSFGCF
uniref:Uncharacterized protein n=1 Tax=viral metagenome TaxID=1070528 RepID=A0A6C0F562_9ZZZZ|tara:strand:- start:5383 stop:5619 length:237 start_codon:yes stop_codon:yes gene_type:complete